MTGGPLLVGSGQIAGEGDRMPVSPPHVPVRPVASPDLFIPTDYTVSGTEFHLASDQALLARVDAFMPAAVGTGVSIDHLPLNAEGTAIFQAGRVSNVELVLNDGKATL